MGDQENLQLIEQESFLNYCFKRNDQDVQYWEEWLLQNPQRRQEVDQLRQMLLLMGEESRTRTISSDFASLQNRINHSAQGLKVIRSSAWLKWSIAASVLVLLSVGLLFYISQNTKIAGQKLADVAPGGNKATLILASGKKIDLSGAGNGAIADETGIKVIKTAEGKIIYDLSNTTAATNEQYNTIETPKGGQYQVNLADGTKVWLNAASSLRYPTHFSGNERRVELTGEGYFEVAHQKDKPFKVASAGQTVEVLGTHFNIMAYHDEPVVKTTLLQGSVRISMGKQQTLLKPGEQALRSGDKISVSEDVDMEDVVAWKNGYFKFNESLEGIMSKISRWYGVEVVYETKTDPNLTYSGKISRGRNISAILKIIEFNGDVHFRIEGRKVYVTK
ncbi:FecR family protein [Pedobacter sp. UBA5917]|jgi:ferric-dicitrate binding protein FerR (iron transport regulator)|uniref:FecR family protein n=1 Tax=Pedobacter sp. UBA5917 TaxID=1947061 RepID=UPI0025EE91FF|nr:FecR family protein [Pedobacter sp. UBA5917]